MRYQDSEGNQLSEPSILSGKVGLPYESEAKEIPGWYVTETPENASGTFTKDPQEVVYVYERSDAAPVTVRYVDTEGNQLSEPSILSGKVGLPYESEAKEIPGWHVTGIPDNSSGIFTENPQEVVYIYAINKIDSEQDNSDNDLSTDNKESNNRRRTESIENGKCLFKKVNILESKTKFEKEEIKVRAILELKENFKVKDLLILADIAKSTYYYWVRRLNKPDKYSKIKEEILAIVKASHYTYGYRRVTFLLNKKGIRINHKTVRRLIVLLGVTCQVRIKKYRSYKGTVGKVAPNILNRNFESSQPNQKWVTDVTQFQVNNTKLYLSPILDLYNGEIVSYTLYDRPTYKMVEEMIELALKRPMKKKELTIHSDQGWHCHAIAFS